MGSSMLQRAIVLLLLSAVSFAVAHGARLLMRRMRALAWLAGVGFGFFAFLANRVALAGAAWLIYAWLFGKPPELLTLVALVGVASAPLLLSFVYVTPFFGPGVQFILYLITLLRLASLTSLSLGMDWLGCLGWWTAAWLLTSGAGLALKWLLQDARWLGWTGIFNQSHPTPQEIMTTMPGFSVERHV